MNQKDKQIQSQTANSHRYQYAKRHTIIIVQRTKQK